MPAWNLPWSIPIRKVEMSCGRYSVCAYNIILGLKGALLDSGIHDDVQIGVTHSTRGGDDDTKTLKQLQFQVPFGSKVLFVSPCSVAWWNARLALTCVHLVQTGDYMDVAII